LGKQGLDRHRLNLAWSVDIADDAPTAGRLVAMRDQALAMAPTLGYTITSTNEATNDPNLLRQVLATLETPRFLEDDSGSSFLHLGADGAPAITGMTQVPIVINIPACAKGASAPLPLIIFGHGLFGNAKDTLTSPQLTAAANQRCAVFAATDWLGLSSLDFGSIGSAVGNDLNNVYLVQDRLQQAH